jgi:pimeloyl-ACP methyl ester carboxylesterase
MPELKRVRANGLEFAYFEEGDGPLVILAHGFPDTAHTWDEVRPAVARAGYRAVTPFMRGYHPTEVPRAEAFDSDTLGRDLLALGAALGFGDEKPILVGHDWGASACFSAAGLEPDAIRLMITVAIPQPAGLLPTPKILWAARHFASLRRRKAARMVRKNDFAYIDALVRRWSPAWRVPPDETRAVKEALSHPGSLEAALGYYHAIRPLPPKSQRRIVRVPSVAIAGTDDIVAASAFHQVQSRYAAGYEVIEMPGGHFMHREHPERFIEELVGALEKHAEV